jgi:hypothetical protein
LSERLANPSSGVGVAATGRGRVLEVPELDNNGLCFEISHVSPLILDTELGTRAYLGGLFGGYSLTVIEFANAFLDG